MKTCLFLLAGLALLPAGNALAHGEAYGPTVTSTCCDAPARWAARHDSRDARLAITTENGDATLLITDTVVATQLSDRALHKVRRKLREKQDEDGDNPLGQAIKAAVFSSISSLLDHSAECPLRDLRDAEYRHGRIVLTTEDGERLFDNLDVDNDDVMRSFSEADARAFVREFYRAKARLR